MLRQAQPDSRSHLYAPKFRHGNWSSTSENSEKWSPLLPAAEVSSDQA
jgi:hypothetical protein